MDYLVVIEPGASSVGAYVPDLPGLGVVGRTVGEVKRLVKEAIELHVAGLREDGLPVPKPSAQPHAVTVPARPARRTSRPARNDARKRSAQSVAGRRTIVR